MNHVPPAAKTIGKSNALDVRPRLIRNKVALAITPAATSTTPTMIAAYRVPRDSALAVGGPFLTVRKFAAEPYTIHDLIAFGWIEQNTGQVPVCYRIMLTGQRAIRQAGVESDGWKKAA